MPYTDVNDLGDLNDIEAFIADRDRLPRHMTRTRKAQDMKRAADLAETLAAIINAEVAIDPYQRSADELLSGPHQIDDAEAQFIAWALEQQLDLPHRDTLRKALLGYQKGH